MNVSITIHVAPSMAQVSNGEILDTLSPILTAVTVSTLGLNKKDAVLIELQRAIVCCSHPDIYIVAADSNKAQRSDDTLNAWAQNLAGAMLTMRRNIFSLGYWLLCRRTFQVEIAHTLVS